MYIIHVVMHTLMLKVMFFYLLEPESISIQPKDLKEWYLLRNDDRYLECTIYPSQIIFSGLPRAHKSAILAKLLTRYVAAPKEGSIQSLRDTSEHKVASDGFGLYEVIAVGNKYQKLHWSEITTFSVHHYCVASAILHNCGADRKVLQFIKGPIDSLFQSKILNKHFKEIYEEISKLSVFRGAIDDKSSATDADTMKRYLSKGITIFNFLKIGFNRAVPHMLSALTGYLINSFPCLFLDLDRDADNLYTVPEADGTDDSKVLFRWRPRIQYLLRSSLLAKSKQLDKIPSKKLKFPPKSLNRKEVCLVVAVHKGHLQENEVQQKLKRLQNDIKVGASQMGVLELIDLDLLCIDISNQKSAQFHEKLQELKRRLEDKLFEQGKVKFPLSWIFLRSSFYHEEHVYIKTEKFKEMAMECKIDGEECDELLSAFAASGSIFYAKDIPLLKDYVILKPSCFLKELQKVFYPDPASETLDMTKYGIVLHSVAHCIFKEDSEFYTHVIKGARLGAQLSSRELVSSCLSKQPDDQDPIYYMPNVRRCEPLYECQPHALHVIVGLDVAPVNTQVAFTSAVIEIFKEKKISIQLIPCEEVNVTEFQASDGISTMKFQLVYHGDATEIRTETNGSNSFVANVCNCIIQSWHKAIDMRSERHGIIKYSFVIMCMDGHNSSATCNVSAKRHHLPDDKQLYRECSFCKSNINPDFVNCWNVAVKEVTYIIL